MLFQHARARNSECWIDQVPAFESAGSCVVTYDCRGYGQSRGARETESTVTDDLKAFVDAIGLDSFCLIAHAASGVHAFDFPLDFAEFIISW